MLILTLWKADANISMRADIMIKGFPSFPKDLCTFTPNLKYIYCNIFWHKRSVSWDMLMAMYHHPLLHWLGHTLFPVHHSEDVLQEHICLCSLSLSLSSESEQGPRLSLNSSEYLHPQMTTCSEPSASSTSISRVPLSKLWMNLTLLWQRLSPESSKIN